MTSGQQPPVIRNVPGINKVALVLALGVTAMGVFMILSTPLTPFGILVFIAGLIWTSLVIAIPRPPSRDNQQT